MATESSRLSNLNLAGLNREKLGQVFNREKLGNVNVGQKERLASVLGGAALAALAMRGGRRNKGILGLAALAGLPLLWRGATGHCAVYQKLGIDKGEGSAKGTALASQHASTSTLTPSHLGTGSNPFNDGRKPLVDEEPSAETNPLQTF